MKKIVQTTLWVFIVVFCLYYIFTNPQGTAGIVRCLLYTSDAADE